MEDSPCPHPPKSTSQTVKERGKWGSKKEFLLSVAGAIIGLGNVWRFPYLCYKNGGGAFFIPYILFLVTCGIPLFILETAMGQYTSRGGIVCWKKICPLFEGLGYTSQVITFYGCASYIVVLAWAFLYFFSSFSGELPWATCNNIWNTESCVVLNNYNSANWTSPVNASSSVVEFWQKRVLNISTGIETCGHIQWDLSLCLLLAWIISYFCVWKGVRSTGKTSLFTATFPFVMLVVLFVRGMTLPGAIHGIKYYLYPNHLRLTDPQGTFVYLIVRYTPLRFNNSYVYPWWGFGIGWFLAISSLMMIPITMVCKLAKGKGTLWQRLRSSSQPMTFQ